MTGRAKRPDSVSHLLSALHQIRTPGHSQLYLWMRRNHDRLAEGLTEVRPNWRALATRLGEMDIRDGTGKAPTPEGARATWYRVRRDLAAARTQQTRDQDSSPQLRPGEIAPGIVATVPSPSISPAIEAAEGSETNVPPPSRPKLDIRPARPRGEVSAPQPAAASAPTSEAPGKGPGEPAEAQLRRVLDAMASAATPLPRIVPPDKKS